MVLRTSQHVTALSSPFHVKNLILKISEASEISENFLGRCPSVSGSVLLTVAPVPLYLFASFGTGISQKVGFFLFSLQRPRISCKNNSNHPHLPGIAWPRARDARDTRLGTPGMPGMPGSILRPSMVQFRTCRTFAKNIPPRYVIKEGHMA